MNKIEVTYRGYFHDSEGNYLLCTSPDTAVIVKLTERDVDSLLANFLATRLNEASMYRNDKKFGQ